ncbi:MAG TPA: hypothetical protein VME19_13695 [Streptosporangiaceae bacterium]|nr:hypothetical protein [Streptosporangiaceae bacterium]
MELPDRTAEPFQEGAKVRELTLDFPKLAGLEQDIDPPEPAPHLGPGAAEVVGHLKHPSGQHGPLG